jgi:hypothetical protein
VSPRQDHDDLHGRPSAKPSPPVLVVVTGGRDRHQDAQDALWLRAWLLYLGATVLGHGDCYHRCTTKGCARRSIDRWAGVVAQRLGIVVRSFPAHWDIHGLGAGTVRNLEMLAAGPVAVLALPGARGLRHNGRMTGTGHTIYHARARGIPAWIRGMDDPPA